MVFTSKWATRYFTARFLKTLLSGVLCLNLVLPAPLGPSPAYALRPISLQENSGLEESVSEALAPGAHRATLFGPPIFREGVSIYSVAHEGRQSRVRIQIASRRPIPSAAQVELLSSPVERWAVPGAENTRPPSAAPPHQRPPSTDGMWPGSSISFHCRQAIMNWRPVGGRLVMRFGSRPGRRNTTHASTFPPPPPTGA